MIKAIQCTGTGNLGRQLFDWSDVLGSCKASYILNLLHSYIFFMHVSAEYFQGQPATCQTNYSTPINTLLHTSSWLASTFTNDHKKFTILFCLRKYSRMHVFAFKMEWIFYEQDKLWQKPETYWGNWEHYYFFKLIVETGNLWHHLIMIIYS